MIGKTLAHYEITSQIGKGGMGEVYQATDTKLGRDVAIKVLPEEFAKDTDRVARFQREAKLLASLNHPNIAAIYGLEESDGTHFLVMELIEGNTLADRIKTGAIPVEEALKLALQIAEALEAAHEKGVIHRDLKPANIKVTPDGKVKVLDFGLAKAFAGERADLNLSNSPTLSVAATQQGVILGTAAYMSPEQARGKPVDQRADIWAFGVVLFEMLTGKQVFTGDTVSDTLASVLAREPEWQSLPKNLNLRIRLMLERCLKKDPRNRYGAIGDARVDIQEVLDDQSNILVQSVLLEESRTKFRTMIPWLAVTLILGAVIAGFIIWNLRAPEPLKPIIHLDHNLRKGQHFITSHSLLDVSPDGTQVVYVTNNGLYLRLMSDRDAKPIPNESDYETSPFFSPDGKSIGYISNVHSQLRKIRINGGAAEPICDVEEVMDAFWYADKIIFYERGEGIMQVPAAGGNPELLIPEENPIVFPRILPDGKSIIYQAVSDGVNYIFARSLKSKEPKRLFKGENAFYIKTGHLVYVFDNNIWVVPFDKESLDPIGDPKPVIKGIWKRSGAPQFAVSNSGTLAYLPMPPSSERTLLWVDREGNEEEIPIPPRNYIDPRISPNGDRIALSIFSSGGVDISVFNLRNGQLSQVTDTGIDFHPFWDPDGQRIYYSSLRKGVLEIYSIKTDGSIEDDEPVLQEENKPVFVDDIFMDDNDAKTMIYGIGASPNMDIAKLSLEGESKSTPLLSNKYSERNGKISPDGKWLAYESCKEGQFKVYICSYPDMDVNEKISQGEGHDPLWSIDGSEVFYRSEDYVMAVPIKTEPKLEPGRPKKLFKDIYALLGDVMTWDIDPKSGKFLMVKDHSGDTSTESTSLPEIYINFNWFEELKEKAPVQ